MLGWLMKHSGPVSTFRPVVHISAQPVCMAYFTVPSANPTPLGTAPLPAAPPVSSPALSNTFAAKDGKDHPIRAKQPSKRSLGKKGEKKTEGDRIKTLRQNVFNSFVANSYNLHINEDN